MSDQDKLRQAYIKASHKRVAKWSEARREAFYKVIERISGVKMSNQKYTYQEAVALAMQGKTLKTVDSEGETYTLSYDEYGDLRFEGEPHYDTDSSGDEYSYSVEREYNVELNPGVLLELPDELIHLTNCDWEIVE